MQKLALAAAMVLATTGAALTQDAGRSIIVLDGSGSMWGQIDGRPKLEIAREALGQVLKDIPAETQLGLMAYGHRTKGECTDIELMVPPAQGTGAAIAEAAAKMQFLGKTPLSDAVRMAAGELRSTEEKATVILITDGIETCNADPCALGTELEASGVDFTAHVVGFGLTADEGKQVACLAENTGGQYIEAKDAGALKQALTTVVQAEPAPQPEPEPEKQPALAANFTPKLFLVAGGPEVAHEEGQAWELYKINADGSQGEWVQTEYGQAKVMVEPGTYRLLVRLGDAYGQTDVTLAADAVSAPEIVLNAGQVILHPKGSAEGPVESSAAMYLENSSGVSTTYYGTVKTYLAAGPNSVTATMGAAVLTETIDVVAGKTLEKDIIIGTGHVTITPFYAEGVDMGEAQPFVEILPAKAAIDGSRETLAYTYGKGEFDLPAGDYIARVTLDAASAEMPFSLKVAERLDMPGILNAGLLAASGTITDAWEVFEAKKAIDGSRKSMGYGYGPSLQLTLPAGDYVVVGKAADVPTEAPFSIKPGERTEVTLP